MSIILFMNANVIIKIDSAKEKIKKRLPGEGSLYDWK